MFEGLLNHSLDSVRFSIYADKDNTSNVLELYTFCFHYSDGVNLEDRHLAAVAIPGQGRERTAMANALTELKKIISHLCEYNQLLPDLPRECESCFGAMSHANRNLKASVT